MSWAGFESMILVFQWNVQRKCSDLCDLYDFLRMGRVARKDEDVQSESRRCFARSCQTYFTLPQKWAVQCESSWGKQCSVTDRRECVVTARREANSAAKLSSKFPPFFPPDTCRQRQENPLKILGSSNVTTF